MEYAAKTLSCCINQPNPNVGLEKIFQEYILIFMNEFKTNPRFVCS